MLPNGEDACGSATRLLPCAFHKRKDETPVLNATLRRLKRRTFR